ncbi:hypothetical protein GNI_055580 [Gregarina niphandrodes]|uniref:Transmembrane protein n=1 Tax=Gregarina niphandrodes TaxID=110365 RepID=A0A023B8T5_GRENI|nr:hypothetical protein GNI_055580 [Gregarina niphandrodes]EZG70483.1 hypothetical protein GNI_055580 [Gregarina niphandrodes]|eukprot:XP_011129934.1 hypothetical protein GNI_055580 [Gregarina niphandrodes]
MQRNNLVFLRPKRPMFKLVVTALLCQVTATLPEGTKAFILDGAQKTASNELLDLELDGRFRDLSVPEPSVAELLVADTSSLDTTDSDSVRSKGDPVVRSIYERPTFIARNEAHNQPQVNVTRDNSANSLVGDFGGSSGDDSATAARLPQTRAARNRAAHTGVAHGRIFGPELAADLVVPRRLWKAISRFSVFDSEGQRRSVRAGGLSALLSQLWIPSHLQRHLFPPPPIDYMTELKRIESRVHHILTRDQPPTRNLFEAQRDFGPPLDLRRLISFAPLLP